MKRRQKHHRDRERRAFLQVFKQTPEEWLEGWYADDGHHAAPYHTTEAARTYCLAAMLVLPAPPRKNAVTPVPPAPEGTG